MLAAAISAVEAEITKISSKTITEAELEKLGSYAVPAPYQDVLKNNNRFPAPPFSAVAAVSKSEIPPSPRSTRRNPIAEDDVSSLASSTVRRSRRGKAVEGLTEEQASCLCRCDPFNGDETNGFFVSYFARIKAKRGTEGSPSSAGAEGFFDGGRVKGKNHTRS